MTETNDPTKNMMTAEEARAGGNTILFNTFRQLNDKVSKVISVEEFLNQVSETNEHRNNLPVLKIKKCPNGDTEFIHPDFTIKLSIKFSRILDNLDYSTLGNVGRRYNLDGSQNNVYVVIHYNPDAGHSVTITDSNSRCRYSLEKEEEKDMKVEGLFQELVEMTREFAKSSIDDLYHSEEKKEEARVLRERYKNHPLKFEDLGLEHRRELGFGTWSDEAGEYQLIPLWVFRLLDPEQVLICPLYFPKEKIARVKNCDDDTQGGMVAYQFYRYPTEEELKKLDEDEKATKEESATTLGDIMKEYIEKDVTKPTHSEEVTELTSDAQLIADLTWNARKGKPEVDVEAVIGLTRNLANFGFSDVTITLPCVLSENTERRYVEALAVELRKKGFMTLWYDSENTMDAVIRIDWSHLLKD